MKFVFMYNEIAITDNFVRDIVFREQKPSPINKYAEKCKCQEKQLHYRIEMCLKDHV